MAEIRLTAQPRNEFGKGAARRLRRDGQVPAVLYGDGEEPRHISLDDHALSQALKQTKVILEIDIDGDVIPTAPRDIQRHPVRHDLKHLDLITLDRAALRARQVEAEIMGRAEDVAVEKELDPIALSEIVSEMLGEGADPDAVIDAAVERLEAELNIRILHIRRLLDAAELQPELSLPRLDVDEFGGDPERIADLIRRTWLVPSGPIRSATSRACPPAPKVQSITVSPGCGPIRSTSSRASTGMCPEGPCPGRSGISGWAAISAPVGAGRRAAVTPRPRPGFQPLRRTDRATRRSSSPRLRCSRPRCIDQSRQPCRHLRVRPLI